MSLMFWILLAVHIFLCFFLIFLVLLQNDKMGGLAGLTGVTSQSFSGSGAATFVQKLTRGVALLLMAVVIGLSVLSTQQESAMQGTELKREASGLGSVLPQGVTDLQDLQQPAAPQQ
jgi:preprotein translocase subunit SecG